MAAAAAARDFLSARSPGGRIRAEMSKGKSKIVRAAPKRLARPVVRRPIVAPAPAPPLQTLLVPPPEQLPPTFTDGPFMVAPVDLASLAPPTIGENADCLCNFPFERPVGPGVIAFGPGGGSLLPPPGGGFLLPPPGAGLLPPPGGGGTLPRPPGIPEPNAWGMMILGFAAIGVAWRRRRTLIRLIAASGLLRLQYRPAQTAQRVAFV